MYNIQISGGLKSKDVKKSIQRKVKKKERKRETILEENRKHKISGKFELKYISNNIKCK